MDFMVLPLALVLMGMVLPRANPYLLWMVPVLTMVSSVATWSMVLLACVRSFPQLQITQFTPSIMMTLSLGMGIDYTLFLLARYLEAMDQNHHDSATKQRGPAILMHSGQLSTTRHTTDSSPGGISSARDEAILSMLTHGGQVLLWSGGTLLSCFLGLCWLPLHMLQSVGLGAAIAIASTLLVNVTIVPCLLYTPFGRCIVRSKTSNKSDSEEQSAGASLSTSLLSTAQEEEKGEEEEEAKNAEVAHDESQINEAPEDTHLDHLRRSLLHEGDASIAESPSTSPQSIWHRLSRTLLHPYRGIILLLVILQLVFFTAQYAWQIKTSISFDLLLPANSPSLQTYHDLTHQFGAGRLLPYRILFDGSRSKTSMNSVEGFDIMHQVIDQLTTSSEQRVARKLETLNDTNFPSIDFFPTESGLDLTNEDADLLYGFSAIVIPPSEISVNGIAYLKNRKIPHSLYISAKICGQVMPLCPIETFRVLNLIDAMTTSTDKMATFMTISLAVDPFSSEGIEWLDGARATLDRLNKSGRLGGVTVYLQGISAIEYDAMQAVYSAFPAMICITMVVVFVLLGFFFRSVFLPLRSLFSISLTLGFAFGLASIVYQLGILEWTGIRQLTSSNSEHGLCWLVPIMAFSIVVGLALDYDIFLVSRIVELRHEGYEHKSSIAAALDATGGVITAAGMIMALAVGSLMFGSNPVLYQWSFVLTTAVLFDVFVVRSLVVPIVTKLAGPNCWWPRQLPESRIVHVDLQTNIDDAANLLRILEETSEYETLTAGIPRHEL